MRWASLPGFGGRIPLSSDAIEPVEGFLTTAPDDSWLEQHPAPRSPWGPVHGTGFGSSLEPDVRSRVFYS